MQRSGVQALDIVLTLLALAAYLVVAIIRMPDLYIDLVAGNSDATTYMLLSKTLAQGAHGAIYLSHAPWYSTIFIDVLTYHLPGYRAIWTAWPLCVYLAGVGLLALTVLRLGGRWAALMTATLCLALTPAVSQMFLAQAYHELTTITCILLAAFLVFLVDTGTQTTWLTLLAAAGLGIFTGVNAASDLLLTVIGIVPLTGVTLILLARYRDRAAIRTALVWLGMMVIAEGASIVTVAVGNSLSLDAQVIGTRLVRPHEIIPHLEIAGGVVWAEVGAAGSYLVTGMGPKELVVGVAAFGTIIAAVILLATRLLRYPPARVPARTRPREAHYLVWTAVAAADFAALAFTIAPVNIGAIRYATVLWIAAAALFPLLVTGSRLRRLGFALLVTGLVVVHTGLMWAVQPTPDRGLMSVVAYLESHRIRYGYADYWESNSVTWETNGVLTLRPALSCDKHGTLCVYESGTASAWYAPEPGWSAVIVDPRHNLIVAPAAVYGPPREVMQNGQLTVYIYDHDLRPLTFEPMP